MNAWWFLSFPALVIIAVTAAARLHVLGRDHWANHHHVRRVGLIGVGATASLLIIAPFLRGTWALPELHATWLTFLIAWSWALVWLTTPGMEPWWDFILGVHRNVDDWGSLTWTGRIRAEGRALANSFKPYSKRKPLPAEGDTTVPPA